MKSHKKRNRGFTLIELMVVLIILALLAVVIAPNVVGKSDEAKMTKAKTDIAMIESLLDQFYLDMGRYPTSEEGVRVLYYQPEDDTDKWKGPYPKKPIPNDPWDNPYIYESPGTHSGQPYELASYGKDGEEGGEEYAKDIVSWVDEDGEAI
ncbi:MAG: type II secretion system major pseudopilin GspG [bacterium]|nr:type II secretion system major pseudopilin GspG [bacterium]